MPKTKPVTNRAERELSAKPEQAVRVACDDRFIVIELTRGLPRVFRIAAISDIGVSESFDKTEREAGRVDVEITGVGGHGYTFSLTQAETRQILNAFQK